ncbi:HOL1 [Symbiodinium natans]|uniref:HOL1 protein n=1 Tax=Symbiodinium natans TaxID=878477 RepID=A0A812LRR3_9DINO|nr:HOL1 [Symbiodinium natans]
MSDPLDADWLRRGKWRGFYDGTYAPHRKAAEEESDSGIDHLPWRSHLPASQLLQYIGDGKLLPSARALELGCGTGENLVALAHHTRFVCGIDIVEDAVKSSQVALREARMDCMKAQVLCADVLELPDDAIYLLDGGSWEFDFIFDCQCFHCLYQVDAEAAAQVYAKLLAPGGKLLMLTGNSEEVASRGPVQLSYEEVFHAFDGTDLFCAELMPTRFDWTETYRKQSYEEPPLGWLSLWCKPEAEPGV